jgi:hypothetical protein
VCAKCIKALCECVGFRKEVISICVRNKEGLCVCTYTRVCVVRSFF